MSGHPVSAPGYFGKVVTHGDFVTRRLPADFVAGWDRWLQAGLLHSRQQLGPAWLAAYLNSPVWHFALAAGLCGTSAVAGVLIPSVDRVGRYFPLTVAGSLPIGAEALVPELFDRGAGWFDALTQTALSCLAQGYSLACMDAALAEIAPGRAPRCAAGLQGRALFWTAGTVHMAPTMLVQDALPTAQAFTALLTMDTQ